MTSDQSLNEPKLTLSQQLLNCVLITVNPSITTSSNYTALRVRAVRVPISLAFWHQQAILCTIFALSPRNNATNLSPEALYSKSHPARSGPAEDRTLLTRWQIHPHKQ